MTDQATATDDPASTASDPAAGRARLLLVTGMSGAGKSSTLKVLEDLGYEAVDNLPLRLLGNLVGPLDGTQMPLAIGVDIRTRDFGVAPLLQEINAFVGRPDLDVRIVFLDCDDEVLRQRYTETRRRHPMADDAGKDAEGENGGRPERRVTDSIKRERELLLPLRDKADLVIDTSHISLPDLRRVLSGHFALQGDTSYAVSVVSFAYRHGIPREADLVFDVRFLKNPHYEKDLRPLTGRDEAVGRFIAADPDFDTFFDSLTHLLKPLLPRFRSEGKSYLTIAVGCTGGQHRSVYVAEKLAGWLTALGESVSVTHREVPDSPKPES